MWRFVPSSDGNCPDWLCVRGFVKYPLLFYTLQGPSGPHGFVHKSILSQRVQIKPDIKNGPPSCEA